MRMLLNNGVRLFKLDLILGHPKIEDKSNNWDGWSKKKKNKTKKKKTNKQTNKQTNKKIKCV